MADERIEIEITLDDGEVKKGFAKIKKESKETEKSASASFAKMARSASLVGAALATAFTGAAIAAASRQEDAINNLNTALILAGDSVKETSKDIQDFAAEIERTTKIGDEAVLEQFALARAFARSADEAKELVTAAIDLSAATGMELNSAVRNLGKTFSGLQGEIGESVAEIRNLTRAELEAGAALDVVKNKFGGAAKAQIATFSGAMTQAKNSLGTFLENVGLLIIRNPAVVNGVRAMSVVFSDLAKKLTEMFPDTFKDEPTRVAERMAVLNDQVKILTESANGNANALRGASGSMRANFVPIVKETGGVLDEFTKSQLKPLNDELAVLSARQRFLNTEAANEQFQVLKGQITAIRTELDQTFNLEKLEETSLNRQRVLSEALQRGLVSEQQFAAISISLENDTAKKRLEIQKKFLTEQQKEAYAGRKQLANILVSGATNTVRDMGIAFGQGKDVGKAFISSMLNTFGDFAIQYGMLAIGIGKTATALAAALSNPYTGPAAIPLGLALIALGGVLKGMASSTQSGGFEGATSGASVEPPAEMDTIDQESIAELIPDRQSETIINVDGTILDPRSVGLQIAEVLKEVNDSNDILTVNV